MDLIAIILSDSARTQFTNILQAQPNASVAEPHIPTCLKARTMQLFNQNITNYRNLHFGVFLHDWWIWREFRMYKRDREDGLWALLREVLLLFSQLIAKRYCISILFFLLT